jgi:hypothetical protein
MRYDLIAAAQKPDLRTLTPSPDQKGPPPMFFDVGTTPDHDLLLPVGARLDVMTETGAVTRSWPLKGFGWACVAGGIGGDCAYLGNWFTGEVMKLSLTDGQVMASTTVGKKCISGIAQYAG